MCDAGVDYLFDQPPAPGTRFEVVPGIDWVCMPLPFALNHVNCWLLHDGEDNCLIDTGVASDRTRSLWQQVLGKDEYPEKLLVTHYHPDHIGLAGWFAANGSHVLGSDIEMAKARRVWQTADDTYAGHFADWCAEHGVSAEMKSHVRRSGNVYRMLAGEPPTRWRTLSEERGIDLCGRHFEVLFGRGHAPAMIMLYAKEDHLLIAADQVLPAISPNISLLPGDTDPNPLESFLDCLDTLRRLPEDTRVLPSHGRPFTGLHARIDQLVAHHEQRCADVVEACREPCRAVELFPVLFTRELDEQQLSFALGETLAHLALLEQQGKVRREEAEKSGHTVFVSR